MGILALRAIFTDLFLTRSLAHPRLLIGVKQDGEWFLFSAPQPQNPSSLVVTADFHMKMSFDLIYYESCRYASGLLYFPSIRISKEYNHDTYDMNEMHAICNPSTGQSEKVEFLNPGTCDMNATTTLINYKGKLGLINMKYDHSHDHGFPLELDMWVLEDIEKREFSAYVYTLRTDDEDKVVKDDQYISVVGANASGEIVLVKDNASAPFYVFYFNPERNILRSVEIQGITRQDGVEWSDDYHEVYVFVDHVEDLNFDITKKTPYAAT
ncbi:PREDICTED: putative F-box protein At1g30925 [Camelina sativa]|uniref:F-box protein At1g30925 n=1 Tax=Camelina sativa TaxID=90675 RepID=A0ABM0X572_CAMSA|nr:PREDICTED: putative F-box protein At1g30925 [Camelina sativa]